MLHQTIYYLYAAPDNILSVCYTRQYTVCMLHQTIYCLTIALALYPGHVVGGKSGLVSTVCVCANDSGNFLRTSPNTDKLHMVVMRRNSQTRYTACSVAAVFTWRLLYICRLHYLTETSLLPRPCTQLSNPSRQPTTSCQL